MSRQLQQSGQQILKVRSERKLENETYRGRFLRAAFSAGSELSSNVLTKVPESVVRVVLTETLSHVTLFLWCRKVYLYPYQGGQFATENWRIFFLLFDRFILSPPRALYRQWSVKE